MMLFAFLAASLLVLLAVAYLAAPAWIWTVALGAFAAGLAWLVPLPPVRPEGDTGDA